MQILCHTGLRPRAVGLTRRKNDAQVAQQVEHVLGKDEVGGSSPLLGLPRCLHVDEFRYESGWW